ncbi:hypothetical protein FHS19_003164 [Paenibacillus rhizosphaerae]|uniref:Uncharacterized protein n=1 Tax=Paenibacillus rhizosphaerae TaxID=297318 RepID=A0A839TS75_9BACL|nr:hypothetical protein [Paenibacillus rhizosphaerae]MBB3128510.1 hypothetical protein [Paenibacillus rhizosphaerae]
MEFFDISTRNLLTVKADAGVGHHIALSVAGTGITDLMDDDNESLNHKEIQRWLYVFVDLLHISSCTGITNSVPELGTERDKNFDGKFIWGCSCN